jgi:small-conductance mechanosensitive channel
LIDPIVTPAPTGGPTPSTTASPDCLRASDLCKFVFDHTGNRWLASSSYYLLVKPLKILLIIVVAMIIRYLLHKAIRRLIGRAGDGETASALRPLRVRLQDTVFRERRRQRAEAIGSVLMSSASAAVFSIAGLMILAELGIELGPLLASAGIAGIALGFGAQTLVKDLIAGLFMLLEDQYGVGDSVDLGQASGVVESVGLRTTSIRDARGVLWHIRNGEVIRVGNKSQGWAVVMIDVPVGFARIDEATAVLRQAAATMADDPAWQDDLITAPEVLGVEQFTVDGAVLRTSVKANSDAQFRVTRELRSRLMGALAEAGITDAMSAGRVYIRPTVEGGPDQPDDPDPGQESTA